MIMCMYKDIRRYRGQVTEQEIHDYSWIETFIEFVSE